MLSQLLRDTDAVSMSHSLEVRVPFLDTRLAEISFSTLDNYLIKNSSSSRYQRSYGSDGLKRILGDAFKEEMPNGFFERKKTGFQLPFNNWMKNGLKPRIVDTLNSRNDYLNYAAIQNELKLWEQGKTGWKSIYMLFVFQSWCNANKIS
jgi:asparagine synthase (glutamine-hydrolysing)